jgi:ComF family protein
MFTTRFSLLDVFFPKFCFNCKALGAYICSDCASKLLPVSVDICPYCEKTSRYGLTHGVCSRLYGLDGMMNVFYYDETFRQIIKSIKFRRIRAGVSALVDSVPEAFWKKLIETSDIFFKDAHVMAVPLHKKRHRERGFNQSYDFAHACAIMLQKNTSDILVRTRYTEPQSQLSSATERYVNIYRAFSVKPSAELPKKVIIVDDVWTTGATIREIAHTLKQHGVERVYALTFARRAHAQYA